MANNLIAFLEANGINCEVETAEAGISIITLKDDESDE